MRLVQKICTYSNVLMSGNNHVHAFSCLGNNASSVLNNAGEWEGNNASATGQQQAQSYVNSSGEWISANGERLGNLQATPIDWVLTPMRYQVITIPVVSARFEIRVNCDWCGALQSVVGDPNNYDSSGVMLNVEKVRELFIGELYNKPDSSQTNGLFDNPGSVPTQWKHFIETILHYTAWAAVDNTSNSSRSIDVDRIKADLTYTANVNETGTPDDPLPFSVVQNSTWSHRCILGLYQDDSVTTHPYDKESLGQLINNTSVQQILTQLRSFGAFGGNLPVPEVNPVIGIVQTNSGTNTYRLFKRGDALVFPINIKSIVGHTESSSDENFKDGYSFVGDNNQTYDVELRIVFQQSVDTDSSIDPTEILDEWQYHDTLRWHEPTRTFQTIRYDQNENAIIVTPVYDENGNRLQDNISPA